MALVNRRLVTGTHYFISIGAAVDYYSTTDPCCTMAELIELVAQKIDNGDIVIACPLNKSSQEYYALNQSEGRYFHISEPIFRSRPRSLASQL